MATESLLITKLPDGTYHVKETEAPDGDGPPIDQSVQSCDDIVQLVQQWCEQDEAEDGQGDDSGTDDSQAPQGGSYDDMWNQEASKRTTSGYRNESDQY